MRTRTDKATANIFPRMGLTAAEQREFQQRMERKQMKEFMGVSRPLPVITQSCLSKYPFPPNICLNITNPSSQDTLTPYNYVHISRLLQTPPPPKNPQKTP